MQRRDGNYDAKLVYLSSWERKYAKLGKMPSWDTKLLEAIFSCFTKNVWMPS
jgi:hypothetical protein